MTPNPNKAGASLTSTGGIRVKKPKRSKKLPVSSEEALTLLYVSGAPGAFHCKCGVNTFRVTIKEGVPDIYECTGCGLQYTEDEIGL